MLRRLGLATLTLLLAMNALAKSPAADDDLLPVEQAFNLSATPAKPGQVKLHWDIADHYYLYRSRIRVKVNGDGVEAGKLSLPDGLREHDEYLGDVEIYHDSLTATLPYTRTQSDARQLTLAVLYQGCHETDPKICYPPHTQTITLALPATAAPAAANSADVPVEAGGNNFDTTPSGNLNDALVQLGSGGKSLTSGKEPLPPEQAFVFQAIANGPHEILARWIMPAGYYLYRDKSHIRLLEPRTATLGPPQWPKGVQHADEHFGTTEVYFNEVDVPVALEHVGAASVTLEASFQGCQDNGVCYPVMTRQVSVTLPAAAGNADAHGGDGIGAGADALASPPPATASDRAQGKLAGKGASSDAGAGALASGDQSSEQRLAGALAGHGRWLALLWFFGAGLLLAFTPCVFPMIPILSGIIAGAGEHISSARAFVLSLVYVLAASVVFTLAGVIAGLVGANVAAAFQQPWILWSFALLFVLLALSMFGFYELQLPSALQARLANVSNRQKSGSLAGVAVMGVLSALIVGPCVAPPLAAAVLYISQTRDPVFGGLALFLLSLGMGAPLLVFGTAAGTLLPRAGAWMEAVKAVFGVLFLALAIWMLARILDPLWIMLMSGALLIACAVYLGALERLPAGASGWRRLWKALGLVLLIAGTAELLGAASGAQNPLQPLGALGTGNAAPAESGISFQRVKSVADLDRALAAARAESRPVMLDFYADWCVSCKEMEHRTFPQPEVQRALAGFVLLQADVTANDATDQALLKRFGLFGPPATIFFDPTGREQRGLRLIGFENAADFSERATRAAQG